MRPTDLQQTIHQSAPLGQKSPYPTRYDKNLLFPVARAKQRQAMKISPAIIFHGFDIWNAYELFWLDLLGKPVRSYATFIIPASSPNLSESKSVKLYLNSLNHERFASKEEVVSIIGRELSEICRALVQVIIEPQDLSIFSVHSPSYRCLDHQNIGIDVYQRTPALLTSESTTMVHDKVVSHLFKSHCLCTGQPDMGSIFIEYRGPQLADAGLLKYLISYRDHVGFSENCIEQIFVDISERIGPEKLTVYGRFTRRGGIDINPYRSSHEIVYDNSRLIYQ